MSGLPREVVKWIQSLELRWKMTVPKWDLDNGYLVAEILSKYFPGEIRMYSLIVCTSLKEKVENWYYIKKFNQSKQLGIPEEMIDGTIHCKEGAASQLLEFLYKMLTNRMVKKVPPKIEPDYTDYSYQIKLPMHARSTASTAVKNNLRLSEILYDESGTTIAAKSEKIISAHFKLSQQERREDPDRFGIKPTLAERCVRRLHTVSSGQQGDTKAQAGSSTNSLAGQAEMGDKISRSTLMEILQ
ncbi:spermatogenesis-associated protein 4-like [Babylonia areolata]|uniref:spermatogenesis-associated protein 4-like n=1 Tax=Babylonia areolata TaxID=304850 RepID=UPI003FD04ACF